MSSISTLQWTEKYRPETLNDIIGNEGVVQSMDHWADTGELPNVLLSGPAGTGKTAVATAFAKDFYGDDWRQNFFELNASDDRGIDVVRENIKSYAQQGTSGNYPFKIIFLDESDSLTDAAMSALRRVMEDYAENTRFILSCNYVNELIDPIQSRCTVFRVSPLSDSQVKTILQRVVEGENLDTDGQVLDLIVEHVDGDARKAINTLQAAVTGDRVTTESISGVVSPIDSAALEEIMREAIGGNLSEARGRFNQEFLKEGIAPGEIAAEMMSVIGDIDMDEHSRCLCIDEIGEFEYRCLQGANAHVQGASLLANLHVARHISFNSYQ